MISKNSVRTSATLLLAVIVLPALFACSINAAEITIQAGQYHRPAGPAWFSAKELDSNKSYNLVGANGKAIPIQVDHKGRWWLWAPEMKTGENMICRVESVQKHAQLVELKKVKDDLINVTIDGELFTALNYGKDSQKPFLYPVIGPTGAGVTRNYPMKQVPFEGTKRRDHPHHQSMWAAWGDLRTGDFKKPGTNYWHRPKKKPENVGRQQVRSIIRMVSGPVFGQLEIQIDWCTGDGKREMAENRTYTFFRADANNRIIDVKNIFSFPEGDVMFADTKEGGIVCLRIATSMDEVEGGRMFNSKGQEGAKQCWGQAAEWCDYVGPVEGKTVGIAIMDAKTNFRHPTRWHIRNYGLYTANPFGLSYFVGKEHDGSKIWKKGESARFNYRVLIHKGDTKAAHVSDQYQNYIQPVTVIIK
ncbi:MAG: PmoA family protein [Planctomycetota bacterium]|nr:MAG: PmoA family protein [Planctomycetota bacterium]